MEDLVDDWMYMDRSTFKKPKDKEWSYNYPDCYLNNPISHLSLQKMEAAFNKGIKTLSSRTKRGCVLDINNQEITFTHRDFRTLTDCTKMSEYLMQSEQFHQCVMYNPYYLPYILNEDYFHDSSSSTFEEPLKISSTMLTQSLLPFGINLSENFINEDALSLINFNGWNFWRSCVINQAQITCGLDYQVNCSSCVWTQVNNDRDNIILKCQKGNITVYLNKSVVLLYGVLDQPIILNRNVLLLISDLIQERLFVRIACVVGSSLNLAHYPDLNCVNDLFKWGDNVLKIYGNKGYSIISSLEAMCIRRLSMLKPDVFNYDEFYEGLSDGLSSDEKTQLDLLDRFLSKIYNPHHISQLFGFFRLWGHPLVRTKLGLSKIRRLAGRQKKVIPSSLDIGLGSFRLEFINNFIKKEGKWPLLKGNKKILHLMNHKKTLILNQNVTLEDLLSIKFEQNFKYNIGSNLSSLISDKTVSLDKPDLITHIARNGTIGPSNERRVVIKMITNELYNVEELLAKIDLKGFNEASKVVGALEKERELKIDPRMFAILPYEARMYIVATEDMIAKHILPYFPQITKSWTSSDLIKSFQEWTNPMITKGGKGVVRVIFNMDFEKWNTNMRAEITEPIFRDIDNIMGYNNLISMTHEYLRSSTIYSTSTDADLQVENGEIVLNDWAWNNHLGGLEGLRQGGWTVITVSYLNSFFSSHGLTFKIIGQGDNQVIRLDIPINQVEADQIRNYNYDFIKRRVKTIKDNLIEFMGRIGLPLKAQETWESINLFAYGKEMIFNGMPLTMDLKRISRMFGFINTSFPTLDTIISNIFASGIGASTSSVLPLVPYFMSVLSSSLEINRVLDFDPLLGSGFENIIKKISSNNLHLSFTNFEDKGKVSVSIPKSQLIETLTKKRRQSLYLLLSRPKSLGGFGVQPYSFFVLRGFPDSAYNTFAQLIKIMDTSTNREYKESIKHLFHLRRHPDVSPTLLFENPDSLNLMTISASESGLKELFQEFIKNECQVSNEWFSHMMEQGTNGLRDLADSLYQLKDCPVSFMADILDSTIPGFASKIISQVEKSSTLSKITMSSGGDKLRNRLNNTEFNSIIWQLSHFFLSSKTDYVDLFNVFKSNMSIALTNWRTHAWRKEIKDVTVPHPTKFLHDPTPGSNCKYCIKQKTTPSQEPESDYFLVLINDHLSAHPKHYDKIVTKYAPYVGSSTTEKVESWMKKANIHQPAELLKKAAKLYRLIGWTITTESPAHQFLNRLWKSMTDLDPQILDTSHQQISGSVAHRYHSSRVDKEGFYTCLYGPLTHLSVTSNKISTYSRGSKNVMLHYQSGFVHIQSNIIHKLALEDESFLDSSYHFHFMSHEELPELDDLPIEGDSSWDKIMFPIGSPPFTYFPQSDLQFEVYNFSSIISPIKKILPDKVIRDSCSHWIGMRSAISMMRECKNNTANPWDKLPEISLSAAFKLDLECCLLSIIQWLTTLVYKELIVSQSDHPAWNDVMRRVTFIITSTSLSNFSPLYWFFSKKDMWMYWVMKSCMLITSYPSNLNQLKIGIKKTCLGLIKQFRREDFIARTMNTVIIVNSSQYWDYEPKFKILSLSIAYYLSNKNNSSIQLPLKQLLRTFISSNLSHLIGKLQELNLNVFPFHLLRSAYFGSFESILKQISPFEREAIMMADNSRPLLNSNKYSKEFVWLFVQKNESTSSTKYREIVDYTEGLHQLDDFKIFWRTYPLREPRGPTSSVLKYTSLFQDFDYEPHICIILGDGTGGTSRSVLITWSEVEVHSFTKKDFNELDNFFSQPSEPFEYLLLTPQQRSRLKTADNHLENSGDIFSESLMEYLVKICKENKQKDTMLLVDIEGRLILNTESYIFRIFKIISILTPKFLLLKLYLDMELNVVEIINFLSQIYESVIIKISAFSNPMNKEIFIHCKEYQSFTSFPNVMSDMSDQEYYQAKLMVQELDQWSFHHNLIQESFDWRCSLYSGIDRYNYLFSLVGFPISIFFNGTGLSFCKDLVLQLCSSESKEKRMNLFNQLGDFLLISYIVSKVETTYGWSWKYILEVLQRFGFGLFSHPPYLRWGSRSSFLNYFAYPEKISYRKSLLLRAVSFMIQNHLEEFKACDVVLIDQHQGRSNKFGIISKRVECSGCHIH